MGKRTTGIEWTEQTWNPFVGCSVYSDGCKNCYAMNQAARMIRFGNQTYAGTAHEVNGKQVWTGNMNPGSPATWERPRRTGEPTLWFVNSMSDFWHENALDIWRQRALDIMLETSDRHCYQVLTKRPHNIAPFAARMGLNFNGCNWFPDNVWIGATVENNKAVHRIDELRRVKAAVRFLSIEPLIGPVGKIDLTDIHWVIAGGESGGGARRCDIAWVREVRDQCVEQDVPFFFKQWGKIQNNPLLATHGADFIHALEDGNAKGGSTVDDYCWKEYPRVTHPAAPAYAPSAGRLHLLESA